MTSTSSRRPRPSKPSPPCADNLERISRGLYCAELVDRLTPDRSEANPIFRLLHETLGYLNASPEYETATRRFELRLLGELGYRPSLSDCAACGSRLEPVANFWSSDAGGAVCPSCADDSLRLAPLSVNALKMLRLLQRSPYEDAARIRLSASLASEIETCLGDYVRYVLEREVRSAGFVETLRRHPPVPRTNTPA